MADFIKTMEDRCAFLRTLLKSIDTRNCPAFLTIHLTVMIGSNGIFVPHVIVAF